MPLPRIGIYEPSAGPSGPSRYVESLLAGLDPNQWQVNLFAHAQGPYQSRPGVRVIPVCGSSVSDVTDTPRSTNMLRANWRKLAPKTLRLWSGFSRECLRLAACFKRWPMDLFHTNNTGCEESAVAARLAGVANIVGTFHVDATYDQDPKSNSARRRTLEYLSNHCLDRAIAVSHATRDYWINRTRLPAQRVVTIPNGVDANHFFREGDRIAARRALGIAGDDAVIVGGVGRLEEVKGFDVLLEAVAPLVGVYPQLHVALAGHGSLQESLTRQAERLGISHRVHFLGFQSDARMVYQALDIVAAPSLCESLSYVVMEAMAMQLPVVGSRVGGIPELILPGETGFLVPPRDADALAGALRPLLDSAELRNRLGHAGRERVERHFSQEQMVSRTLALYRQMLERQSAQWRQAA